MLQRLQKSMKEKDEGFTLIELLVVVIIIGILAGIAIPVFLNQRQRGVDSDLRSDLRNAGVAASTITTDNPTSTTAFTSAALVDAGWEFNDESTFVISGTPAAGDFCITGRNPGSSLDGTTTYVYSEQGGGLQEDATTCAAAAAGPASPAPTP